MTPEKRNHKRTPLRDIVGSYGQADLRVVNASNGGLCLEGSTPLPVGRSCLVRLHVDGRSLHISGTVSWCKLVGTKKTNRTTVQPVYLGGMEYDRGSRDSRPLADKLRY